MSIEELDEVMFKFIKISRELNDVNEIDLSITFKILSITCVELKEIEYLHEYTNRNLDAGLQCIDCSEDLQEEVEILKEEVIDGKKSHEKERGMVNEEKGI